MKKIDISYRFMFAELTQRTLDAQFVADFPLEGWLREGASPRRKSEAMLNLGLMKSTSRGRIDICDRRSGKPSNQYPGQFLLSAMTAIEEVDCRAADYFRRSVIWFGPVMSVPGLNGQREHGQIGFEDTRD